MQHINGKTLILSTNGDVQQRWTAEHVRDRLAEAYDLERRVPGRIGPERLQSTWRLATLDSFSDRVAQGETARDEVWERWARAGGLAPDEVARMEQALDWPRRFLLPDRLAEARALNFWAFTRAYGRPLSAMLRARRISRTGFYRLVGAGAQRIATALELTGA